MPLSQILLTDTFSQWMTKDNAMITAINSLSVSGDLLSVSDPVSGQILVWNGSFFTNVTVSGDATIASDGTLSIVGGGQSYTEGRIYFAGNIRGLY
jgi:hypothetical protein